MYNQALRSESKGDIELAAIGFRSALEILVKDYAVNELKINVEEVSRKSLFDIPPAEPVMIFQDFVWG